MSKVTTALIGCGQRGPRGHGKVAKESEKLELMAVCDIDESRAKSAGEMLGVGYVTDYHELLSRDDLESVIIYMIIEITEINAATTATSRGPCHPV